jgi:PIN domain nuclease of toxin-antitoxin system
MRILVKRYPNIQPGRESTRLRRREWRRYDLEHTTALTTMPFHHRDAFDRLIIAQATVENVPVVSGDTAFDAYGISRIW